MQTIQDGMKEISGEVGMNFIDWPNQGKPVQWVQGMNQALDRKANVINLLAGINPGVLGPQIAKAEGAGAAVVASHLYDVNQPATNGADSVSIYYEQAGRLLADWVIAKTGGKATVLAVTINEVVSTKPMMTGIQTSSESTAAPTARSARSTRRSPTSLRGSSRRSSRRSSRIRRSTT